MTFKQGIKDHAPAPVRFVLKRIYQYWLRMSDWWSVLCEVRGATFVDSLKLTTSLLAAPITSLPRLGQWQYPKLLFDTNVRVLGGMRFSCTAFSDQLFQITPSAQRDVTLLLRERLRPGDTFVDAGANVGFFTVLAGKLVGDNGSVLSVEMMPDTARLLRRNLLANGIDHAVVVENALSDVSGQVVVARQPVGSAGQASISTIDLDGRAYLESEVRTLTLDEACASLGPITLLKADLEGQEEAAFRGGSAMLARTRAVVFECWPDDPRAEKATALLLSSGFVIERRLSYNLLAVRAETAAT